MRSRTMFQIRHSEGAKRPKNPKRITEILWIFRFAQNDDRLNKSEKL
ncbi:hypothetical protein ACWIUD_06175 [Helicobacter sp. 23-1044]